MAQKIKETFKPDYILLVEAGFIAVNQADEDAAVKLFRASQMLEPDSTLPQVGLGYLHLCKLELKEACRHFEEALQKHPYNEMAKAFLGFALALTPHKLAQGEEVLEAAAQESRDPAVKKLAADTIEFLEKYMKKLPSPVEIGKPKGKDEKKPAKKHPKK